MEKIKLPKKAHSVIKLQNTYILLDAFVCSIAVYFYELCRVSENTKTNE